jgi:hypothetical protein
MEKIRIASMVLELVKSDITFTDIQLKPDAIMAYRSPRGMVRHGDVLLSVNRRAILSRLVVETASNSFHLSVSPSSVLAGGIWSVLHGYNL